MMPSEKYENEIRVQVTKRLPKRDIQSIVKDFAEQRLTFAVSQINSDFEVWRQILPGDLPRVKNRKDGMTPAGVIEEDVEDLSQRNFVCIWDQGELVFGDMDSM
ncbi:MAG: hypothetical protein C4527_22820 [Candidatus Omnitrophota bacterium]|jgi:hypothetical protein|nr:MAG: hypothetical protein C4527_22820 [Candidatus Omnitrophota bacterium]